MSSWLPAQQADLEELLRNDLTDHSDAEEQRSKVSSYAGRLILCLFCLLLGPPSATLVYVNYYMEPPPPDDLSGLIFEVKRFGDNKTYPHEGDTVTIHYDLRLKDGTQLFSSWENHRTTNFIVGDDSVPIKGVDLSVRNMTLGEMTKIHVPSRLAFGARGRNNDVHQKDRGITVEVIPPNADLDMRLELIEVHAKLVTPLFISICISIVFAFLAALTWCTLRGTRTTGAIPSSIALEELS